MIYFIVNPTSGTGNGKKAWRKIKHELDTRFKHIAYTVYFSKYTGHLSEIFCELEKKEDIEKIIAVGGDGTLNETVNGLARLHNIPLVCVSGGTSNDFVRSLHLPVTISKSVSTALLETHAIAVDSCRAVSGNFSRLFVNGIGFGYDGEITSFTERSILKPLLRRLGISKLMYIIYGLRQSVACKRFSVQIEYDGNHTVIDNCYMVTAMVNPFEGGGIYFAPSASPSDGLTDLVCIHSKHRFIFAYHVIRALLKLPAKGTGYTVIQFKQAHIRFSSPQTGQIDGEHIGKYSEMQFESLHRQFQLVCSPASNETQPDNILFYTAP